MTRVASGSQPRKKIFEAGNIPHGTQSTLVPSALSGGTQEEQQTRSFLRLSSLGDDEAKAVELRTKSILEQGIQKQQENIRQATLRNSGILLQQGIDRQKQNIQDAITRYHRDPTTPPPPTTRVMTLHCIVTTVRIDYPPWYVYYYYYFWAY